MKIMKRVIIASAIALASLSGCTRVEPNSVGVLQEKYIETWGGKTPIYGSLPTLTKSVDSQK